MTQSNEPAFPACNEANVNQTTGITKREYIAIAAMQGLLANSWYVPRYGSDSVADRAYEIAGQMLAAGSQK